MGWFQRLRGGVQPRDKPNEASKVAIAVGAKDDGRSTMTYNDKSITFDVVFCIKRGTNWQAIWKAYSCWSC